MGRVRSCTLPDASKSDTSSLDSDHTIATGCTCDQRQHRSGRSGRRTVLGGHGGRDDGRARRGDRSGPDGGHGEPAGTRECAQVRGRHGAVYEGWDQAAAAGIVPLLVLPPSFAVPPRPALWPGAHFGGWRGWRRGYGAHHQPGPRAFQDITKRHASPVADRHVREGGDECWKWGWGWGWQGPRDEANATEPAGRGAAGGRWRRVATLREWRGKESLLHGQWKQEHDGQGEGVRRSARSHFWCPLRVCVLLLFHLHQQRSGPFFLLISRKRLERRQGCASKWA